MHPPLPLSVPSIQPHLAGPASKDMQAPPPPRLQKQSLGRKAHGEQTLLSLELKTFLVDGPVLPHSCHPTPLPPGLSAGGMRRATLEEMQGPGFYLERSIYPGPFCLGTQPQQGAEAKSG